MIFFRLAADADQFLTIAKFRALRRLWAASKGGLRTGRKAHFRFRETAWRMMTKREPAVNMLRTTMATLCGRHRRRRCDHGPAGSRQRSACPTGFARRIARNTQLILL